MLNEHRECSYPIAIIEYLMFYRKPEEVTEATTTLALKILFHSHWKL